MNFSFILKNSKMNSKRFNLLLLLIIAGFLVFSVAAPFIFKLFGYDVTVTGRCFGIPCGWSVRVFPTDTKQTPSGTLKVTVYALEKDGGHIFDGATIAVIEKVSGKIVAEQVADQNGQTIFYLKQGYYRFQPSPLKENRVVGFLETDIQKNQKLTLRLTEVGPTAFGAPVKTCDAKQEAINLGLQQANYCEVESDCKFFQPDGFSCRVYINQSFDTSVILKRITDYSQSCKFPVYKCPVEMINRLPLCIQGKCSVDYR